MSALGEFIQIGSGYRAIEREGDGYRVPLARAYADSPRLAHERGLWLIVSSPYFESADLGRDKSYAGVALTLPDLTAEDDFCLVSAAVGEYLDIGQVLIKVRVVE